MLDVSPEFYLIAVVLTTIVSAARITRLLTWDDFPPTKTLREWYGRKAGDAWGLLLFCGYCCSFWVTAAIVGWGWLAGVYEDHPETTTPFSIWWAVNAVFAASYLAAVFMANDGDDD